MRLLPLVALFVLVTPSLCRADAIDGPPACPPGAQGRSSHSGTWCEAAPCSTDADCGENGGHCRAWRVCTRRAAIPPGGLGAFRDPPPPPVERELVVGSCDPTRACRGDEEPPPPVVGTFVEPSPTCHEATFCVPEALPALPLIGAPAPSPTPPASSASATTSAPASSSSCACVAGRSRSSLLSWPALLMLVLAARRGRR